MPYVTYELKLRGVWQPVGAPVGPNTTPCSIACYQDGKPRFLLFGWSSKGIGPCVWESELDVTEETMAGVMRVLDTWQGLTRIADLRKGPFERTVFTKMGEAIQARWSAHR